MRSPKRSFSNLVTLSEKLELDLQEDDFTELLALQGGLPIGGRPMGVSFASEGAKPWDLTPSVRVATAASVAKRLLT
ncbi:hypothetical protein J1605_010417 [Eschrichtius robustus]|uniref:Uncharacterized protein n=1 Tax=Eschrichtius robustus TaxID=9764 RepID=A0AB34GNF5_ESCRO|nr:hypothetical protein J1605_010417 [Eschrichtius robustus]